MQRAIWAAVALLVGMASGAAVAQETGAKPLKALLVTGGCCHDYDAQKHLISKGVSARANVEWTLLQEGGKSLDHKVSVYSEPNWAKNYDVIVHDECFANVKDKDFVDGILKAHKDGVPAVNLHCAMHCYRVGDDRWFEFLGLQSSGHGPQKPIEVALAETKHPILAGLSNWKTVNEELYNNLKMWDSATALARGKQVLSADKSNEFVVVWTNLYGPNKTRVFCTTLGHNNDTVTDERYLDLVTRGLLWSCGKLGDDGQPKEGYGVKK